LQAQLLRRIAVVDSRGASIGQFGISTRSWLRVATRAGASAASAMVRLARALHDSLPVTARGVAQGNVTLEQARVIQTYTRDPASRASRRDRRSARR
jgi:Domain of unknown function (DUF222)